MNAAPLGVALEVTKWQPVARGPTAPLNPLLAEAVIELHGGGLSQGKEAQRHGYEALDQSSTVFTSPDAQWLELSMGKTARCAWNWWILSMLFSSALEGRFPVGNSLYRARTTMEPLSARLAV
ncbi:hypothetical protein NDU88_004816 [Pleurodeles waltl]|uniref:Uncharacterized protein n=1 Tax=Pleurodeles waltl TaxID=8319 RepID=A0AAV7VK05_PLEWA|nr:hypothetical protein NDU88_004816 [Pleurodeles waltl]